MTSPPDPNKPGRAALSQRTGSSPSSWARYIQRRERGEKTYEDDLLAAAAGHGNTSTDVLRVLLACHKPTRAREDPARGRPDRPADGGTPPGTVG